MILIDSFIQTKFVNVIKCNKERGFVSVETANVLIYSCYFLLNRPVAEFEDYQNRLGNHVGKQTKGIIIGGDLNAKARLFGSNTTDAKRKLLDDGTDGNDLVTLNEGHVPTYSSSAGSSIVDITIATIDISRQISGWQVDEITENINDHNTIHFELTEQQLQKRLTIRPLGWLQNASRLRISHTTTTGMRHQRSMGQVFPAKKTIR